MYTYRQTDTALIALIALQTLYNQTRHKQDEWPRDASTGTDIGYLTDDMNLVADTVRRLLQ